MKPRRRARVRHHAPALIGLRAVFGMLARQPGLKLFHLFL